MTDTSDLPIFDIARLELRPGDTLIARIHPDVELNHKRIDWIHQCLEKAVEKAGLRGQVLILVGDHTIDLQVMRRADGDGLVHPKQR